MNGRRPTGRPTRRYQSGGMMRENNMQNERMMDQGMRKEAQADMKRSSPEQDRIKKMLMEEIRRRKQGGMGQPSPDRQRMMQQRAQQDMMDKKMQGAAAKPPAQRGYRSGGGVNMTPQQKARLMQALRNRRGR